MVAVFNFYTTMKKIDRIYGQSLPVGRIKIKKSKNKEYFFFYELIRQGWWLDR